MHPQNPEVGKPSFTGWNLSIPLMEFVGTAADKLADV